MRASVRDALRAAAGPTLVAFSAHLVSVVLLGDWIIDDAGISFAYAKNLAAGHGLVAQPGRPPVEGFSNFLWLLLLVPFFWLGLFDPIWLPKVVSALLVLASLGVVAITLEKVTSKRWPAWLATGFLATAPPIVIWTASGLENALLFVLVTAAWATATLRPPRWEPSVGALAALLAMTRPDALVFAAAAPSLAVFELALGRCRAREALRQTLTGLAGFTATFVPFFTFRQLYFGLPWPHTYYAKLEHASHAERLEALFRNDAAELRGKLVALGEATAGPLGPWLFAAVIAAAVLAYRRALSPAAGRALVLCALGSAACVWLPNDWMGEHRFATPVVATAWIFFAALAHDLGGVLPSFPRRSPIVAAAGVLLSALILGSAVERLFRFAGNPPTPYGFVKRQFADRFSAYADALGVRRGSILIADAGAPLFESKLRVYDVAGLTEPAIIRTLRKGTPFWHYHHPAFYHWVFEEIRPTFVVTYAFWTNVTALEQDPRFARDYVAIESFPDGYVKATFGRDLRSGEFVRRDALRSAQALETMRNAHSFPPLREPLARRLSDWMRRSLFGRSAGPDDLRREAREAVKTAPPDWSRAAALLDEVSRLSPSDAFVHESVAAALDDAGRAAEARPRWRLALRAALARNDAPRVERALLRLEEASMETVDRDQLARLAPSFVKLAQRFIASNRPAEARRVLERVVEAQPQNAFAHYALGVIAGNERRHDDAIASYRRSLAIDPASADAQNNLGVALIELGRYDEAIPALEAALKLRPDYALARANLAWARSELERARQPKP